MCIMVLNQTIITQNSQVNSDIVNHWAELHISNIEMPFMASELIEIYKNDTTILNECYWGIGSSQEYRKSHLGSLYLYDMSVNALVDSLCNKRNDNNNKLIDKIISEIDCHKPIMPEVDWGNLFLVCETCPFGEYPPDVYNDFKAALIYAGEKEIKQMISFENEYQWKQQILDIQYGNGIAEYQPNTASMEKCRRIMQFLIDKWSPCQIPEIQELVKVLKENLPLDELVNPVDVIKGNWRGSFGNKTINLTIEYDASIAESEKAEAIRTRWGMFKDDNFGVLAKSIFDGQSEGKVVSSKGYYTDGGKDIRINLIEQPDTAQWNGEFNLWVNRKTNKMHGTWESNNKKLKREFELEKVKE